jgi:hypothetical protein
MLSIISVIGVIVLVALGVGAVTLTLTARRISSRLN